MQLKLQDRAEKALNFTPWVILTFAVFITLSFVFAGQLGKTPYLRAVEYWLGVLVLVMVTFYWLRYPPPAQHIEIVADEGTATNKTKGLPGGESNPQTSDWFQETVRWFSKHFEPIMLWFLLYPLFPLQILFFVAVSWLNFGKSLGFPDLVWFETADLTGWEIVKQSRFWNGLAISLFIGNILFVRFLLATRKPIVVEKYQEGWSLFWLVHDGAIKRLGRFLFRTWPGFLALFYIPKMFTAAFWELDGFAHMFSGLAFGILLVMLLVNLLYRTTNAIIPKEEEQNWADRRFFNLPGIFNIEDKKFIPLHKLAGLFAFLSTAFLVVLMGEVLFFGSVWSPVWLLCLGLSIFNSVFGFVTFHFSGLKTITGLLLIWIVWVCNANNAHKMTHPALSPADRPFFPAAINPDDLEKNDERYKKLELLKTESILKTFHEEKWAKQFPNSKTKLEDKKPKLVIIAASGGGIRAAVWTAVVLEGLEAQFEANGVKDFRNHIKLFTGASGGMVGSGLYVADFPTDTQTDYTKPHARPAGQRLSDQLAKDSLWPTVQTMLLHDWPAMLWPYKLSRDRGRTIENAWAKNAPATQPGQTKSPFQTTFAELMVEEKKGNRPSAIFSPMLVDDSRRVMISNLQLDELTHTKTATVTNKPGTKDVISVPGLELWRLTPEAHANFQIGTAARMSATFPFVGPAVSLPTNPPRRVVDAGYYDNFGINLAAMWLYRYRHEIKEHTSGVVIIEIRAYPIKKHKVNFSENEKSSDGLIWAASELSAPLEAIVNLYSPGAYFRNDLLLDILDQEFNSQQRAVVGASNYFTDKNTPLKPNFFTTVAFECEGEAALSWTLPKRDYDRIRKAFTQDGEPKSELHPEIKPMFDRLKLWFGQGGTK